MCCYLPTRIKKEESHLVDLEAIVRGMNGKYYLRMRDNNGPCIYLNANEQCDLYDPDKPNNGRPICCETTDCRTYHNRHLILQEVMYWKKKNTLR